MQDIDQTTDSTDSMPFPSAPLPALTRAELWIGIAAAVVCSVQLLGVLTFMNALGWSTVWEQVVLNGDPLAVSRYAAVLLLCLAGILFLLRREAALALLAVYMLHYLGANLWEGKVLAFTTLLSVLLLLIHGLRLQARGKLRPSPLIRRAAQALAKAAGRDPGETRARLQALALRIDLPSLSMVTISGLMLYNLVAVTATPYRERGQAILFLTPGTSESYALLCSASLVLGSLVHILRKASPTWFFLAAIGFGAGLYFSCEDMINLMPPSMAIAFWGYSVSLGARSPAP